MKLIDLENTYNDVVRENIEKKLTEQLRKDPCNYENLLKLGDNYTEKLDFRNAKNMYEKAAKISYSEIDAHFGITHVLLKMEKNSEASAYAEHIASSLKGAAFVEASAMMRGLIARVKKEYHNSRNILKQAVSGDHVPNKRLNFQLAILYFEMHSYSKALEVSSNILKNFPQCLSALFYKIACLRELRRYEEAELVLSEIARSVSEDNLWAVYTEWGKLARHRKDFKGSINLLRKGISHSPEKSLVHQELGITYYEWKDYDSAIKSLLEAVKLDSTAVDAVGLLSVNYCEVQKFKEAIDCLDKYFEANANLPLHKKKMFRGQVFRLQKKTQKSLVELEEALAIENNSAELNYHLGLTLQQDNKLEEAVYYFKKSREVDPYFINAHFSLSAAYYRLNNREKAEKVLRKLEDLKLEEVQWFICLARSSYYRIQDSFDKKIKCLYAADRYRSKNGQVFYNLGAAYFEMKMFRQAVDNFNKAYSYDSSLMEAALYQVYAHRELGEYRKALKLLERLQPEGRQSILMRIHFEKGGCYLCLGMIEEANLEYEKACTCFYGNPSAQLISQKLALAEAFISLKRYRNSLDCYRQVLELDPDIKFD